MRNISIAIFFLVNVLYGTLFAQVTTPNGTSVDYLINSEGNIALFESQAAQWLSDRGWTSEVSRIDAATATYNCHSFAWYKSQGGTYNYWINAFLTSDLANFDMYSYSSTPPSPYNIQKYWTDYSYLEVPEGEATKVWYGSSWQWTGFVWTNAYDHSAVKLTSGLYESKWGSWPLYVHPADKCPYAIGNRRYFKKAPYIYGYPAVCPSSTEFTIQNMPNGATISWSCSSNLTRVSSQGSNPCQFEANASGEYGWIDATITYNSTQYELVQKTVWLGSVLQYPVNIEIKGENYELVEHTNDYWELCPNTIYRLVVHTQSDVGQWGWNIPASWEFLSNENSPEVLIQTGAYIVWEDVVDVEVYYSPCATWIYSADYLYVTEPPYGCGELLKFDIYPNPSKSTLTIRINENEFGRENKSNYNISIVDKSGRVPISKIIKENLYNLDISNLPNGEYTVVITLDKIVKSQRFVKSN